MLLEDPLLKIVPKLAYPMIIAQLVTSFYGLTDTFFVSQLGTAATAAVGVNDALSHFIQAVSQGFGAGASSYISRLLGGKKDEEASTVASTIFFFCIGFLALLAFIGYIFMDPMVNLLGATPTSKHYTMDYASFILIGAPFVGGTFVLNQLLRSEGSTHLAMVGTIIGCFVNVVLDPLLINILGLEVAGAAIATSFSQFISFCVLLVPYLRKTSMVEIKLKLFRPRLGMLIEVLKMSLPTFIRGGIGSVATTITNQVAGSFGDFALAGMSVSNKVMRFIESIVMGYSQGTQSIIGFCWGAKKYHRVRKTYWVINGIGGAVALVLGITVSFFANNIVRIFTNSTNPDVLHFGTVVFRLQCYTLVFHMLVITTSGFFQALGRAVNATILSLSRTLIVLVPCIVILPKLFDITGLQWARSASDILSFCIACPMVITILIEINREIRKTDDAVNENGGVLREDSGIAVPGQMGAI
jgi:putative MATE family efflux protein